MTIKLYDLAGASDTNRFSPHCWRVRMALAHKNLPVETIPWRFTEKEAIESSGQGAVPVIVDQDTVLHDSWSIATYLEDTYTDAPTLFGGPQGRAGALFIKLWAERALHPAIVKAIITDLFDGLHEKDKAYFRKTREARFGKTLEEFGEEADAAIQSLRTNLSPMRAMLETVPFLSGSVVGFADYAVFGAFQWARVASPKVLIEPDDPIHAWREKMLDLHNGIARAQPAYGA